MSSASNLKRFSGGSLEGHSAPKVYARGAITHPPCSLGLRPRRAQGYQQLQGVNLVTAIAEQPAATTGTLPQISNKIKKNHSIHFSCRYVSKSYEITLFIFYYSYSYFFLISVTITVAVNWKLYSSYLTMSLAVSLNCNITGDTMPSNTQVGPLTIVSATVGRNDAITFILEQYNVRNSESIWKSLIGHRPRVGRSIIGPMHIRCFSVCNRNTTIHVE